MNAVLLEEAEAIEQLRCDLVALAMEKGTFADDSVLEMSQQLDEFLVQFIKLQLDLK
ncbi:aspartyl-phosphate phosphatase Spo0E family protein [Paenibacillus flagellatus]|uniref:Sporulation protein Spo0E n=1 Tax=Paenibacillus flagellatus TaxID=2211139 RepID=A0A2V5K6J3_9BACL|nr:aspartyl-phosphate phosphatase Spo0E family protein [Paenibacillus flagellatus]PYI55039.1 sporulation protein Spo0E [Paenibacillus flagellatus]